MTTSSSSSFDPTRDELIDACLVQVGVLGPGGTPTTDQRSHAAKLLNMLGKSIDKDGKLLWRYERREATLLAGGPSFQPLADVIDIAEPANIRPTGSTTRTLVKPMTEAHFMSLTDRTTPGTPDLYFAEKKLAQITVSLYPVPDAAMTLEYQAILRCKDWSAPNDTGDFPQRFQLCLFYGLTALLAGSYGQRGIAADNQKLFLPEKERAIAEFQEQVGVSFYPMMR